MKKVLLLTNILTPYRVPLYNLLSEWFAKEGFWLKIAFLAENEENRSWRARWSELKAEAIVLPGWHKFLWRFEFPIHLNWGVWGFLHRENFDVIISGGYSAPACWIALAYSKWFAKPFILWTGATRESVKGRDPLRSALRVFFIRQADAFVTYGKKATEYILDFGVSPQAIFTGCNLGDVQFFGRATHNYRSSAEFWKRREILTSPVILYVGQFIWRKGICQLIEALSGLRQRAWTLLLVGDGPMRARIDSKIKSNKLEDRVFFMGFQEKEELAKLYAIADIFVLPSLQDPYSIVMSEALASGLFVVASKYDGAAWDLIEEGKNGIITDPADILILREDIQKAIDTVQNPIYNRELVAQSITRLGLKKYAQAFVEALQYALSNKSSK